MGNLFWLALEVLIGGGVIHLERRYKVTESIVLMTLGVLGIVTSITYWIVTGQVPTGIWIAIKTAVPFFFVVVFLGLEAHRTLTQQKEITALRSRVEQLQIPATAQVQPDQSEGAKREHHFLSDDEVALYTRDSKPPLEITIKSSSFETFDGEQRPSTVLEHLMGQGPPRPLIVELTLTPKITTPIQIAQTHMDWNCAPIHEGEHYASIECTSPSLPMKIDTTEVHTFKFKPMPSEHGYYRIVLLAGGATVTTTWKATSDLLYGEV